MDDEPGDDEPGLIARCDRISRPFSPHEKPVQLGDTVILFFAAFESTGDTVGH